MTIQDPPLWVSVNSDHVRKTTEKMSQILLNYAIWGPQGTRADAKKFIEGSVAYSSTIRSGIFEEEYPESQMKLRLGFDVRNVSIDDNKVTMETYITSVNVFATTKKVSSGYYRSLNIELGRCLAKAGA